MRILLALSLCLAGVVFGQSDDWSKLGDLKIGTELRIYKQGSTVPVQARFAEVTEKSLIITQKNSQSAIPKEEIMRVEYREVVKGKLSSETRTQANDPSGDPAPRPMWQRPATSGSSSSTTTGYTFGSKGEYQVIYKRGPKQ